ncbi:MAG: hypothetical protein OXG15_00435 [Gammaproteobacteria bacterium]|nr:hypothetical protein [Gammaproteobacteria bacterium]
MLTRRRIVIGASLAPILPLLGEVVDSTKEALSTSRLIYLTPIKSDGSESKCKGEIWFSYDGDSHVYVVTQYDAWRANAIRQGLTSARIWVGEFGLWRDAGDSYRSAPELMLEGAIEDDPSAQDKVLTTMGGKYSDEWGVWGPRFREGLRDDSRVMLRYKIV